MDSHRSAEARLFVVGDLYPGGLHASFFQRREHAENYEEIRVLTARHDLSIANLECPLTTSITPLLKTGPHLRAAPDSLMGVEHLGFNLLSLANNHIKDMDEQGLADTIAHLRSRKIAFVGAGSNLHEAGRPAEYDFQGLTIGVIALAENEFSIATATSAGANPLDLYENFHHIKDVKKRCDFLLVIVHGGNEFFHYPNPQMQKTCRLLVDFGADAVVCHHSHVISGYERYRSAPIFYGLGNFIFDYEFKELDAWYEGYGVSFHVRKGKPADAIVIPFKQNKDIPGVKVLAGTEREMMMSRIENISAEIADEERLYSKWLGFVGMARKRYLAGILGYNRVERFLNKRGFRIFWKENSGALKSLKNLVFCESHLAAVRELLAASFDQRN